ncbi:MAG: hypothetical protein BWZ02_01372 [Lentisphaerae bacterium ADurb.BinA184]|nr:MAG: hypothetical protein BWZ02_01372 [Lentisphaerae bacterium ADurb.BinA184]
MSAFDDKPARQSLPAPELLTTVSQPGLEIFQVTTNPRLSANVFYNHAQAIEPTSRFVLINRQDGGAARLTLVDLDDGFELTDVNAAGEAGVSGSHAGAAFAPDGSAVFYSLLRDRSFVIRRWDLARRRAEDALAVDLARPEFGGRKLFAGRWLSFSHDGRRLASAALLEGKDKYYSVAVLTFDMASMRLHTSFETGPRNWNNKSQYAPAPGPRGEYLISVSDSYSQAWLDERGQWHCESVGDEAEPGGSTYLVDEQGTVRYAYGVGRDRPRQNISHDAWFGKSIEKVFHCDAFDTADHWRGVILHSRPVPADDRTRHLGRHIAGANQLDLTRHLTRPEVWHLCVDAEARHMVCDTHGLGYGNGPEDYRSVSRYIYAATIHHDSDGPYAVPRLVLTAHSSWQPYGAEALPFLTPNRKWILFASDYPGVQGYGGAWHTPQVFAVRNFQFPE